MADQSDRRRALAGLDDGALDHLRELLTDDEPFEPDCATCARIAAALGIDLDRLRKQRGAPKQP